MPASPPFVAGGISVGERLEVLVDPGVLLAKYGEPPESPRVLLVSGPSRDFGLLADDLGEVLELPAETVQAPPPFLGGEHARLLRGVLPREEDEILIFDLERLSAMADLPPVEAAEAVSEPEDRPRS